jgi:hypothetical protein
MYLLGSRVWRVVAWLCGYMILLYFVAYGSTVLTTEDRCLQLGFEKYRVTYNLNRYCIAPVNRVVVLEAAEVRSAPERNL